MVYIVLWMAVAWRQAMVFLDEEIKNGVFGVKLRAFGVKSHVMGAIWLFLL